LVSEDLHNYQLAANLDICVNQFILMNKQ
jgi:hypothetical protein